MFFLIQTMEKSVRRRVEKSVWDFLGTDDVCRILSRGWPRVLYPRPRRCYPYHTVVSRFCLPVEREPQRKDRRKIPWTTWLPVAGKGRRGSKGKRKESSLPTTWRVATRVHSWDRGNVAHGGSVLPHPPAPSASPSLSPVSVICLYVPVSVFVSVRVSAFSWSASSTSISPSLSLLSLLPPFSLFFSPFYRFPVSVFLSRPPPPSLWYVWSVVTGVASFLSLLLTAPNFSQVPLPSFAAIVRLLLLLALLRLLRLL